MKKFIYVLLLSFFLLAWASAEYRVYDNVTDFEEAKGEVCETATDGCNTFFMVDWKVAWWTLMFCMDHKPEWTCKKYKEWVMTTKSIITTTSIDEEKTKKELWTNDENFYKTIQTRLDTKFQKIVNKAVYKYENNLSKFSDSDKEKVNEYFIKKVEKRISDLLMKYPADIALPKNINEKYLTFTLLKFELMKLEF